MFYEERDVDGGGTDVAGGTPGYATIVISNAEFLAYNTYFSKGVTTANSLQAQGLTNIVEMQTGSKFHIGRTYRCGAETVLYRFNGGSLQQEGYHGEILSTDGSTAVNSAGCFILESVDGKEILVSPSASSCGSGSVVETRGAGDFRMTSAGKPSSSDCDYANESILGNKIVWNHTGKVWFNNSGSVYVAGGALPHGVGKGDVEVNCGLMNVDGSLTVNSIYGTGSACMLAADKTITVGDHGGDCRYKLGCWPAVGASYKYNGNGRITDRTNYGWDVVKVGAGALSLESDVPALLSVQEGSVSVTAAASVPRLALAEGSSLAVVRGGTLTLGAYEDANGAATSLVVEAGGTLLFAAAAGETREVDLSQFTLNDGSTVGAAGPGKVVFTSLPVLHSSVSVAGGELEIATVAGDSFTLPAVAVADGATLTLDAGVDLNTLDLTVRGVDGEENTTYDGTSGLAGLAGEGSIHLVTSSRTWTGQGADGKLTTGANWDGGVAPDVAAGGLVVTFSADAPQRAVVVDVPARFKTMLLPGVSYSFTGATDAMTLEVGTGGIAVAEPAEAEPVYDFDVKVALSGVQKWDMPFASAAAKLRLRRPLVNGLIPATLYAGGKGKIYFEGQDSTFTGDIFATNKSENAVYLLGREPIGPSGRFRVSGYDNSHSVAVLSNLVTHKDFEIDIADTRRRSLAFQGGTNEFFGKFCSVNGGADNNAYSGTVLFHQGYGCAQHASSYINWGSSGQIHMLGQMRAGTVQGSFATVHLYQPGNVCNHLQGWHASYAPVPTTASIHFRADEALDRPSHHFFFTGTWDFHGTAQRVGSLSSDGAACTLVSTNGPGLLRCRQTEEFTNLAKSTTGRKDYIFGGCFRGEMSFRLEPESTKKLVFGANSVSTATGQVEVAGGTLCFTNGASWQTVTNVVVSGSGRLETYDEEVFGKRNTDIRFAAGGVYDTMGQTQKICYLYIDGVRQPRGTYCAADNASAPASYRRTAHLVGTGTLVSLGDGNGLVITVR